MIRNLIDDKFFLLYNSDSEFRSLSYSIYPQVIKKDRELEGEGEMIYNFIRDEFRIRSEFTLELLRDYRVESLHLQMINGDRWKNTGYVFTKDNGEPMHPDSITAWLHDFSDRTGLPHINPHAFRHTVASVLIANGTDIVTVSKLLGHSNTTTTENIYAHVIEESKEQATDCIADVLLRRQRA